MLIKHLIMDISGDLLQVLLLLFLLLLALKVLQFSLHSENRNIQITLYMQLCVFLFCFHFMLIIYFAFPWGMSSIYDGCLDPELRSTKATVMQRCSCVQIKEWLICFCQMVFDILYNVLRISWIRLKIQFVRLTWVLLDEANMFLPSDICYAGMIQNSH